MTVINFAGSSVSQRAHFEFYYYLLGMLALELGLALFINDARYTQFRPLYVITVEFRDFVRFLSETNLTGNFSIQRA